MYDEYDQVNSGTDKTIQTKDALFYFQLGRKMYASGIRTFDSISVSTYLSDKEDLRTAFTRRGGYKEVETLCGLVNTENTEGYFDRISKLNTLSALCEQFFKSFGDTSRFDDMSNGEVYDFFDYQLNTISMNSTRDTKVESVSFDESFIDELNKGETVGLNYSKNCPRLNWATLGLPLGDLYMLGGFSGTGKTSFVFENMILPLTEFGTKCCIISNEMQVRAYKQLLTIHILTRDLNYWQLTRKHLKVGNFTAEQRSILNQAAKISQEKYSSIRFIKMFDNDTARVIKTVRKYSKLGYQMFLWDTMKSDDDGGNMEMYRQLLQSSRRIFQCASKENVSIVCTYQLALYMKNQRYLDASTLSNGKQIKEVFSEMIYIRELWQDEYTGERYDCHAYTRKRNPDGTWEKCTTPVPLQKDKKYIVAFLDKTRNDEDGQQFLYEANLSWNNWKEVGYCTIRNEHTPIGR